MLEIELVDKNAKMPTRGTYESAGLDFYTPEYIFIPPRSDLLVPLGLKMKFPEGWALIFKEKSGIATRKKIDIGACVVDSDYRGIVHAHLINNSDDEVIFYQGDKVVQGIMVQVWLGEPKQVDKLNDITERGSGGFGSTGEK